MHMSRYDSRFRSIASAVSSLHHLEVATPIVDTTTYLAPQSGWNRVTTDTAAETDQLTERLRNILQPYSVILHNDDVHSMDFVVDALLKSVQSLSEDDAVRIMLEAHNTGSAIVITCPLEHAELYRDRLRSFDLGVTIEPA